MEKIYTNKKFKRFIGILLAVIILFNVATPSIITPKAHAIDVGGILLLPLTYLISILADVAQTIIDTAFKIADIPTSGGGHLFISEIVYDKIPAFRVNIFDSTKMKDAAGKEALINTMLPEIQKWYGYTRVLAIAAALVMLVYVAIQILISTTTAGDKAKYKQLLKDWVLSLLLIFTMHFIMAGILYVADAVTAVFAQAGSSFDAFATLNAEIAKLNASGLIYAMLKWVFLIITLAFVLIYTKRVIMIAFLTIIAPLVAISYSVDKIRDGKSQILDKWMKEYVYNALTMPMDALLFTVISSVLAANLNGSDGNIIFAVALVVGYLPLRGWFNEFLGTDKASHGMSGAAAGAAIGSMIAMKGKGGKGGGESSSSSDGTGGNAEAEKEKIQAGKAGGGNGGPSSGTEPAGNGLPTPGNPALSGDSSERVTEPTSTANRSGGSAAASSSSNTRGGAWSRAGGVAGKAGKALGKTASRAATGALSGAVGLMTMAATGNATAAFGATVASQKALNSGSEYGLGGKLATGARNKYDSVAGAATYIANGGIAGDEPITAESLRDAGVLNAAREDYGKDNIKALKEEGFNDNEINQIVVANMQEKIDNMSFSEMNAVKRKGNKEARKETKALGLERGSNEAQAIRAKNQIKAASASIKKAGKKK